MNRKGNTPWIWIAGGIAILSLMFTMISQHQQKTLDVYNQSNKIESEEIAPPKKELDIETQIYADNEHHFSLTIPKDWNQIVKDGFPTFVHSPSASSIQIQVLDYNPLINNANAETLSTQIANDGKTFMNFKRETNSSYELMYQDMQNSIYDYIEEVYWDRSHIIKLVCTFNDKNYDKIIPYYELILNSFAWQKETEIPEGYAMYYNESANFEVLMPDTWGIGATDTAVVATDEKSGASQTITRIENAATLDTITATDMSKLIGKGRNNFMMSSYENEKERALARCTYLVDNIQHRLDVYSFATGTYIYFVMFDYEQGTIPDEILSLCADSFRDFNIPIDTEKEIQ